MVRLQTFPYPPNGFQGTTQYVVRPHLIMEETVNPLHDFLIIATKKPEGHSYHGRSLLIADSYRVGGIAGSQSQIPGTRISVTSSRVFEATVCAERSSGFCTFIGRR